MSIKVHERLGKVIGRLGDKLVTNQEYNRLLKYVSKKSGINKRLTSHLGRHSYSVYWLTKGGSIEVLKELLGHSSIRTTEIYGKIVSSRIDSEVDAVFG